MYQITLFIKLNKYEECLQFILKHLDDFLDKLKIYEKIAFLALRTGKNDLVTEYMLKAIERNAENVTYYLYYFQANGISESLTNFNDLVTVSDKGLAIKLVNNLRDKKIKSKILERIELVLSSGNLFKQKISSYICHNVKQNIPSILNAIKSIYDLQKDKIEVISEIIIAHLKSIEENKCLHVEYTNNEKLDLLTQICWVYFFGALHFDYLRDLERALVLINKAIDSTPSVNEFYTLKSKIFKHAYMLKESSEAYEKVLLLCEYILRQQNWIVEIGI